MNWLLLLGSLIHYVLCADPLLKAIVMCYAAKGRPKRAGEDGEIRNDKEVGDANGDEGKGRRSLVKENYGTYKK